MPRDAYRLCLCIPYYCSNSRNDVIVTSAIHFAYAYDDINEDDLFGVHCFHYYAWAMRGERGRTIIIIIIYQTAQIDDRQNRLTATK